MVETFQEHSSVVLTLPGIKGFKTVPITSKVLFLPSDPIFHTMQKNFRFG